MSTVLVTGATRGIGRETARQFAALGHTVFLGARDLERGRAVAAEVGALPVLLDVTDTSSVAGALAAVGARSGRLDVLVNNAGVPDNTVEVADVDGDTALRVLDTNVAGVVRVTQAALPLLRAAEDPVVVNVGSGLGSFAATTDPDRPESQTPLIVYAASKAALAMLTLKYARALPGVRVVAACPGLTDTDFAAGFPGARPVGEAAAVVVSAALAGPDGPTGVVLEEDGPLAW
ncbi:SDR family NAD(P)-dependent oxidoreductase [Klenkia brasiliensis]|uniref:NADP-dependent 3-hydroxy acid dehydrogenase YdfG n=1 Tax=Klenkia brasiliensis TaxID=333142 RepID=A0A1G8A3D7_9ACTN|nr:SDR family NAD(P)-dependent oxidoreductase [Klenkia brasiliensis]SDH14930.1 NADP-dependent 3-hydroxy acid dehydrogenase YdfG [Klenkia brasiliensis]